MSCVKRRSPPQLRTPERQPASHNRHMDDLGRTAHVTAQAVGWWHVSLRALAGLNVALGLLAAVAAPRRHAPSHAEIDVACYLQLLLCAVYVAGCAFRSVLPVIDIPR